jgi:uncharacterized protein (DUF885 family)
MKRFAPALAAAVLAAVLVPASAEPPRNEKLNALLDREFKRQLEESPETATFFGIPGYDHRLTDHSPEAVARRKAHVPELIAALKSFDAASLATQDRITRDVLLDQLELRRERNALFGDLPFAATAYGDGWLVLSPMYGPQNLLSLLAKATRFRSAADYESYLTRLEAVPRSIDQLIDRMRVGMKTGWMPPQEALQRVPGMLEVYAGPDVRATPLWQPFASVPAQIAAADRERLAEHGRRVLAERVHPAFAKLKRFAESEYIPAARKEVSASRLPAGPRYYELLVRQMTTTSLTPDEIHAIGLAEVARIRRDMDKVMVSTGFKGTREEFAKFLRTDKRFFFATSAERLRAYRDIAKRADAELPKLFAELPRLPYGVRPMDPSEGDNADHYSGGALDGSRAGFFDANVNNVSKKPSYDMVSVLLHEAVPGHHLQNARAQEIQGLHVLRRTTFFVAYGEGWALYAESLGYEMGMYEDPYQRFGALVAEMLRACRLVIDTGLHTRGWTRQQAIDYLAENTGYDPSGFVSAEIDRYIVNPGQALGYKIGELRIKALRAKASQVLGPRFDLRRFHNALLDDGALPLTVLEARIDEWIAKEETKP